MELLEHKHRLPLIGIKLNIAVGRIIGDTADLLGRVFLVYAPGFAGTAVSVEIVDIDKPVFG